MSRRLGVAQTSRRFAERLVSRVTAGRNDGKSGLILTHKMRPDDAGSDVARCCSETVNSPFGFSGFKRVFLLLLGLTANCNRHCKTLAVWNPPVATDCNRRYNTLVLTFRVLISGLDLKSRGKSIPWRLEAF